MLQDGPGLCADEEIVMSKRCEHVLVYVPVIGGYDIACRKCGDVYGTAIAPT
jgi:hypothetical protein